MSSTTLLRELKQVRYGKTLEEIIEQEKKEQLPILSLKLPIEQHQKRQKIAIKNFFLLLFLTAFFQIMFIILTYYLYINYTI